MKKILVIHPALVMGGAETVLINYLNILSMNPDYQVEVLFMENRDNYNIHLIPSNIKIGHALTGLESAFFIYMKNVMFHQAFSFKPQGYYESWLQGVQNKVKSVIKEKLENEHYDIVIDFQRNYTAFDSYFDSHDLPASTKALRWVHSQYELQRYYDAPDYFGKLLPKYEKIVLICEEMQQNAYDILLAHNIPTDNLTFIFNPQNQDIILQKMNEKLSDSDEQLMNEDYIVQVSRLEEHQKNHLQLLDIYAKLKQKGIKQKLYIIGGGWDEHLKEKIQALGLEKDCLLLGSRDNPFPFMKNAKLFLHTAKFEGFGMVLTESMICGTPVVAFGCPTGPSEILGYGEYGEVVSLGDEDSFVEKTYALLNDESKRQQLKDHLPEAVARFNFEAVSKKLFETIDNIQADSSMLDSFKW